MSVYAVSSDIWELSEDSDRRFRTIFLILAIPVLLVGVIIPFLELHGLQRGGGLAGQAQYVEFIADEAAPVEEQAEEPAPAETDDPVPTEAPEVESEQEPVEDEPIAPPAVAQVPEVVTRTEKAREQAKQSGVLAFSDALADLRSPSLAGLDAAQPLSRSRVAESTPRSSSSRDASSAISSSAARSSGGVAATQVQRTQSGTGIGERRTTTVDKPKGFGETRTPVSGQGGTKLFAGRSIDDIQLVMDRNKSAFYAIFNRALRSNPYLQGTMSVSMSIDSAGRVVECKVISSTMGDPEFEDKIVRRIMLINFGAKDVPTQNFPSYPLTFQELG